MAIDAIVEKLEGVDIGVSAADAENVELLYQLGIYYSATEIGRSRSAKRSSSTCLHFAGKSLQTKPPATIPRLRLSIRHGSPFRLKRKKSSRATTSIIEFASMAMAFSTSLRRDFSAKATFGLLRKA